MYNQHTGSSVADSARWSAPAVVAALAVIGSGLSVGDLYALHLGILAIVFWRIATGSGLRFDWYMFKSNWLFVFPVLWFAFAFVSLFWSVQSTYSMQAVVILGIGLTVLYFVGGHMPTITEHLSLLRVLFFTLIADMVLGLAAATELFVWPIGETERFLGQAAGFQGNPNNLAALILMALPWFVFWKKRILATIAIVFALVTILLTYSRLVLLLAAAALPLLLLYPKFRQIRSRGGPRMLLIAIAAAVASVVFADSLSGLTVQMLSDASRALSALASGGADRSVASRSDLIRQGFQMAVDSGFLGVGWGASRLILEQQGYRITSLHNYWIELLSEGGLLLLVPYLVWFGKLAGKLLRPPHVYVPVFQLPINQVVGMSMVLSFFGLVAISTVHYYLPYYILLGLAFQAHKLQLQRSLEIQPVWKLREAQ